MVTRISSAGGSSLRLIPLLVITLLSSCKRDDRSPFILYEDGSPRTFRSLPIAWSFACNFQEQHRNVVRKAFAYWDSLVPGKIMFSERKDCGVSKFFVDGHLDVGGIGVVVEHEQMYLDNDIVYGLAPVATLDDVLHSGLVVLYPRWLTIDDAGLRETVVRHEIGHLLGLAHMDDAGCIMYDKLYGHEGKKDACRAEMLAVRSLYERM